MWFNDLTGFREDQVNDVGAQFVVDGEWITSIANDRRMRFGRFNTPALEQLRDSCRAATPNAKRGPEGSPSGR